MFSFLLFVSNHCYRLLKMLLLLSLKLIWLFFSIFFTLFIYFENNLFFKQNKTKKKFLNFFFYNLKFFCCFAVLDDYVRNHKTITQTDHLTPGAWQVLKQNESIGGGGKKKKNKSIKQRMKRVLVNKKKCWTNLILM